MPFPLARRSSLAHRKLREMNPLDAGYAVEPGVEGGDCLHAVIQHHSGVHRIPAGDPLVCGEKIAGPVRVGESYAKDHRADAGKQVVDVPREISPSERSITVQDLLENLRAGACFDFPGANLIEESTRRRLVRMIRPRYIHRDVGVHKNGQMRPDSISVSI